MVPSRLPRLTATFVFSTFLLLFTTDRAVSQLTTPDQQKLIPKLKSGSSLADLAQQTQQPGKFGTLGAPEMKAGPGLTYQLEPPPDVAEWTPREMAYPGLKIVIRGRNFQPDKFKVHIGDPSSGRSVALPITYRSRQRVDAMVTDAAYTDRAGSPLVVYHDRGEKRVLVHNFKVLNRIAKYRGQSLWHETESRGSSVYTKGAVRINLDKFEFENNGSGTYLETVSLIDVVKTGQCPPGKEGAIKHWNLSTQSVNRQIQWKKLPDGRVELRNIGTMPKHFSKASPVNAIASLQQGDAVLTLEYNSFALTTRPEVVNSCRDKPMPSLAVYEAPAPHLPRPTLVEWSLRKLGP